MGHKGHYGQYTGNAKWSKDHAHTEVTKEDYKASEKDDAAHIDYLKRDVLDDQKTGGKYKDENQTADEKHISKLAGDMKYDKEHHGSPAKNITGMVRRAGDQVSELVATQHSVDHSNLRDPANLAKFGNEMFLTKKVGKSTKAKFIEALNKKNN